MDPYSIIAQMPNAGQAFQQSFNQGMQQNALAGFAQNPNDPRAQGAAARYDPSAVMSYRLESQRAQTEAQQHHHDAAVKAIAELAKHADTPEKWDQAAAMLAQNGSPEAAQYIGKFSPALRSALMAAGGVQDDANADQPKYFNLTPGSSVVALDPATGQPRTVVQPNDGSQMAGTAAPSPQASGDLRSQAIDAIQRGADPAKVLERMVHLQGGQAATPSATFPGPH